MSQPGPGFIAYKYDHGEVQVSGAMVAWTLGGFVLFAIVALAFLGEIAILLVMVVFMVIVFRWPRKRILLGLRYLVCGRTLAYYRNVRKLVLRPGALTLHWDDGRSFTLEEKRFPTNARKDHKIKANKAAKFKKVSDKIIQRVLAEAPAVQLVGIDRHAIGKENA